ncbi:hypothetical protein [Desulforamulus aeronauticus]|uniref:Uncharacterized protein n=1 Tax=Desulforamulus aeronauticus DSM 10349 TaxID=1121421 RepID=A0A1M6XAP9_9FIRM|nr:hypothetical protein [Desulforamulus aeronauticus]SHL03026.1 hypothetical protein SAMN02745123_03963 [Desulforamulus aeronauticus DSM 10349]
MKISGTSKPTFYKFREDFLLLAKEILQCEVTSEQLWHELADSETRERLIKDFIRRMEERYHFEIVLKQPLAHKEGSVEGVVGELYHVFSTMFLVGVINAKVRSGEKYVE